MGEIMTFTVPAASDTKHVALPRRANEGQEGDSNVPPRRARCLPGRRGDPPSDNNLPDTAAPTWQYRTSVALVMKARQEGGH